MITKKLNDQLFAWDPTAYRGKGYWFVMGKNGTFAKAASKTEANQLGIPSNEAPVSPKVYEKSNKVEQYTKASEIRKSKFSESVVEKLLDGQGLGKSVFNTMGEKSKARFTGIKESLNPLNLLYHGLGGGSFAKVITAAVGRKNPDLVRHFIGNKSGKDTASKIHTEKEESQDIKKIYNLLTDHFSHQKKLKEMNKSFQRVHLENEKERFEKLLAAIEGFHPSFETAGKVETKKKSGIPLWLLSAVAGIIPFFKKMWDKLKTSIIKRIGGFFLDFLKKVYDFVSPIIKGIKDVIEKLFSKIMKIPFVKDALDGIKKFAGKAGNVIEDVADKLGIKSVAEGAGKTLTKIAGGALDGAKGVLKLFKYAEKLPVVGSIIAGGQIIYEVREAMKLRQEGKITDSQLHKRVVKILGNVLGGWGGAELGGAIGSLIPIPLFGTLTGALVGGVAGSYGGEWIASKLYDYFKAHNGIMPAVQYKKLPLKEKKAWANEYDEFIGGNDNPYRSKTRGIPTPNPVANRTSSGTIKPLPTPKNSGVAKMSSNLAGIKTMSSSSGNKIVTQTNVVPAKTKTTGNSTVTGSASVRNTQLNKITKKNHDFAMAI